MVMGKGDTDDGGGVFLVSEDCCCDDGSGRRGSCGCGCYDFELGGGGDTDDGVVVGDTRRHHNQIHW